MGQSLIKNDIKNLPTTKLQPITNLNPGKFDQYSKEINSIIDFNTFDGFVMELGHNLNKNFSMSHSMQIGSRRQESVYTLRTGVETKKLSLYGNIDNNGFLRGHLLAQLTQTLSSEAVFNLEGQDDLSTWIWNLEHKGKLSTSRAEITSTSICAFSYYQRVTPKLSLGTRLTYLHPLRQTKLMFIARLRNKQNICSFTYSGMLNSLSLSYVRKIQPRVGFATEIVYSLREGSSFTSLGFKYSLRKVVFHSKITSNDELSTSLEMGFPIVKLTFTAKMDYKVKKYYAGIRVSIGPVL